MISPDEQTYDDPSAVNDAIRAIVRTLLAMDADTVRPGNQDMPVGRTPFATVTLVSSVEDGRDFALYANPDDPRIERITVDAPNIAELVYGRRAMTFSIQFFRAQALARAMRLRALFSSSNGQQLLQARNLGFVAALGERDLSEVEGSTYEERAGVDLTVNAVIALALDMPTFGTFPIELSDGIQSVVHEVYAP